MGILSRALCRAVAKPVGPGDAVCVGVHTEHNPNMLRENVEMLHWDSNKNALWELNHRLAEYDSREVQA